MKDWITSQKDGDFFDQDFKDILFQVLWSLGVFKELGLEHHDLHTGNILITDLQEEKLTEYQLNKSTIFRLDTRWWVRVFDFDHASLRSDVDELIISNPLMCNHPELLFEGRSPKTAGKQQYPEFDIVCLLIALQQNGLLRDPFLPQRAIDGMKEFDYTESEYIIPKWKDYKALKEIISIPEWLMHLQGTVEEAQDPLNLWKMPSVEVDVGPSVVEEILWWSGSGVHESRVYVVERNSMEWEERIEEIMFKNRWDRLCTKLVDGARSGPSREWYAENSILQAQDVAFYVTESETVKGFLFGKVIGMGSKNNQPKSEARLPKTFYVELLCASGYANELFDEAEQYARDHGCTQMALRAASTNKNVEQKLIASYERRGYKQVDNACEGEINERSPSPLNKHVENDGYWMAKCLQ